MIDERVGLTELITRAPFFRGLLTAASLSFPIVSSRSETGPIDSVSSSRGTTVFLVGAVGRREEAGVVVLRTRVPPVLVLVAVLGGLAVSLSTAMAQFLMIPPAFWVVPPPLRFI